MLLDRPYRKHFHTPVQTISHEAAKPQRFCGALREEAEAHSLDHAGHKIAFSGPGFAHEPQNCSRAETFLPLARQEDCPIRGLPYTLLHLALHCEQIALMVPPHALGGPRGRCAHPSVYDPSYIKFWRPCQFALARRAFFSFCADFWCITAPRSGRAARAYCSATRSPCHPPWQRA